MKQGWTDALRAVQLTCLMWTFWAYLRNRWSADKGRLDHLLLSPELVGQLVDARGRAR